MKKVTIFSAISIFLVMLASCSKDNNQQSDDENQKEEEVVRLTETEYKFPHTALRQAINFVNNLVLLNNNIDKTAVYTEEDFNRYYNKKIDLPEGKVSIEDWTANSPDLFQKDNSLRNKAKDRFFIKVRALIELRKKISKGNKASEGVAGYTGTTEVTGAVRYVDEKGIELAEATEKQIMGIVLLDQILNNHLGNSIMKSESLRSKNTNRDFMSGKKYTELEYHWDMAFALLGTDNRDLKPKFIANYIINEFQGAEFLKGIDLRVYKAFREGREALGKADYEKVEKNIAIIRKELSILFAARTIHYLKKARPNIEATTIEEYHEAFHTLSEVYGFIPALIATRKANGDFYITDYNVIMNMLKDFEGTKGFWEKKRLLAGEDTPGSLDNIAKRIAEIYELNLLEIK